MAKKKFNPSEWLPQQQQQPQTTALSLPISANEEPIVQDADVEFVVKQIESAQIDITSDYAGWRDIGFALVSALGEKGRAYFHRISAFYPGYNTTDCDNQYNKCLKATGHGITIRSFFHHAKNAGIELRSAKKEEETLIQDTMPTFGDSVYQHLPNYLKEVIAVATTNEERDLMLLGSLVCLSACLHTVQGIYDGKRVYPNLYLFITAQASAGKGRLVHCRQLVQPIHSHLQEQAKWMKKQYDQDILDYKERKNQDGQVEKPEKPPILMLFIPANNSATGVYQLLNDNKSRGLIFETEGDTLAQAFKTDYGNYSDGFRKAFHHESVPYYRRTEREYVDLAKPCLSTVLSGTPMQIATLIPSAENGLFSRFIFYRMNFQPTWKDVFAFSNANGLDDYFDVLGAKFYELYKTLSQIPEVNFDLTAEQKAQFNEKFSKIQLTYLGLQGLEYIATIRRLGLVAFRICMIFTALRTMEHGELSTRLICDNTDFQTAMSMIDVLVQHSSKVFSELPEEPKLPKRKNQKERFYDELPASFNYQAFIEIAKNMAIPDSTAEGYITDWVKKGLLHREKQNHYLKPVKAGN